MRFPTITVAALLLLTGSSQAVVVAWNFSDATSKIESGQNTSGLDAAAGFGSSPIWVQPNIATSGTSSGNGINVAWNSGLTWSGGGNAVVGNDASQRIFNDFLADNDNGAGSYHVSDGYGVSVQLSGLGNFLATTSSEAYRVTLFWTIHYSTGPGSPNPNADFGAAQIREGNLPVTPTSTAISDLTLLGTIAPHSPFGEGLNSGAWPAGTGTAGARTYGTSGLLTADEITIALPSYAGTNNSTRYTLSGFAIEAVPEPVVSVTGCLGILLLLRRRR